MVRLKVVGEELTSGFVEMTESFWSNCSPVLIPSVSKTAACQWPYGSKFDAVGTPLVLPLETPL